MGMEPQTLFSIWLFLLGAVLGSFLNVVVYRLPRGESIHSPASHCPNCNKPLKPYDNIPILSWLLLGAKCRNCKEPISIRYPIVEFTVAVWFVWMFQLFGLSWEFANFAILGVLLLAVSIVDIDTQLIPDSVLIVGAVIGLAFAFYGDVITVSDSLTGGAAMGGTFFLIALIGEKLMKKESMGFGDVKLSLMIGLFIGWKMAFLAIFLSSIFASVIGLTAIGLGKMKFGKPFAFGPFIALGALVSGIWGDRLVNAYLRWAFV